MRHDPAESNPGPAFLTARARGRRRPAVAVVTVLALVLGQLALQATPALAAPPANDHLVNAIVIEGEQATITGSNVDATRGASSEPNHAGRPGNSSVWYRWTPPTTAWTTIDTCGSGFSNVLAVYTGPNVTALTHVASSDFSREPHRCPGTFHGAVHFLATAGTSYAITVDSYFTDQDGTFQLSLNPPPSNDAFADARRMPLTDFAADLRSPSDRGWTRNATVEPGEPLHATYGSASVWFDWAATGNGPVSVDTCGSDFDTILGVYTGNAVDALTPVVANDDDPGAGCGEDLSRVSFVAAIGQSYKIAVAGHLGATGEFEVTVHGDDLVVPNDDFANAIVLSGASAADRSNNMLATEEPDEPIYFPTGFPPGRSGGRTIWYRWTAPTSGPYEVDTCDPGTDPEAQTVLGVYTGTAVDALTEVAAGSHALGTGRCAGTDQSGVIFDAEAGTTYTFLVGGVWDRNFIPPQAGTIVTSVYPADRPANDDTAFRRHLSGQTASFTQPTAGAGPEPGEPAHAGLAPQASVWFDWVAPASAEVTVDTCGSGYDTVLAAYRGLSLAALTPVAANDDAAACGTTGPSRITFDAVAGVRYWIAVDGAGGATGSLQLHVAQGDPEPTGWHTTGVVPRGPGQLTIRADLVELPGGDRLLWWTTLSPDLATGTVQASRVAANGTAGPVVDLTAPGEPLAGVDLEVLPDGRLALYTVVHTDPIVNHTEVRLYAPDLAPIGSPVRISDDTFLVNSPNAVTGPDGTITFGWSDSTYFDSFPQAYVAKVRRMAPDGTLGPVEILSDPADQGTGWGLPDVDDGPRLGVAADGAVTAVWHWEKDQNTTVGQVHARRIDPGGAVGPLRVIDTTGNLPVVGVTPDGTAVVVYIDGDPFGLEENPLLAVHLRSDGTVGPPMQLDEAEGVSDYRIRDMRVATSDTGRAFVIWHRTAAVDIGAARQIRGRLVNADATTGSLLKLSDTSVSESDFISYPRAAFDQWGNVTATWSMLSDDGIAYRGEARRVAADGTAGRLVQLTPTGRQGAVSDVLVDSTGVPAAAHIAITPPDVDAIEVLEFPVADLAVAATPAGSGSASVTVTNHGPRPSTVDATHPVTVDLTAPAGVTLSGATGSGWACSGSSPLRCTRDTPLAVGTAAPAITVSFSSPGLPSGPGSATVAAGLTTDPDPSDNRADLDLTPTCAGARVTLSGSGAIEGTAGDDVILGSPGPDTIDGKGGDDVICAGAGDDTVVGGAGDDTVYGGDGDDVLDEGDATSGRDVLDGGAGRDTVSYAGRAAAVVVTLAGAADDGEAGEGDDVRATEIAVGGSGADTLIGTGADDRLVGNAGNDRLRGGAGADELVGGAGDDVVHGEDGDDRIDEGDTAGPNGADRIDGGNGTDEVSYLGRSAGVIVTIGSRANDGQLGEGDDVDRVEAVVGTAHPDVLTGTSGPDRLVGGAGADVLTGGGGDDVLVGGTGIDALVGGPGNDVLDGQDGGPADVLHGGAGTDRATSDPGDILLGIP